MAKNGKIKNGQQNGSVAAATQVYNPATGNYIKRESNGKLTEVKSDGKPFKGLVLEKQIVRLGFPISKSVAKKAESAVIKVLNSRIK